MTCFRICFHSSFVQWHLPFNLNNTAKINLMHTANGYSQPFAGWKSIGSIHLSRTQFTKSYATSHSTRTFSAYISLKINQIAEFCKRSNFPLSTSFIHSQLRSSETLALPCSTQASTTSFTRTFPSKVGISPMFFHYVNELLAVLLFHPLPMFHSSKRLAGVCVCACACLRARK